MMIATGFNESFCVELLSNAASNAEIELDALEEAELLVLLEPVELLPEVLELLLESLQTLMASIEGTSSTKATPTHPPAASLPRHPTRASFRPWPNC